MWMDEGMYAVKGDRDMAAKQIMKECGVTEKEAYAKVDSGKNYEVDGCIDNKPNNDYINYIGFIMVSILFMGFVKMVVSS